MYEDKTIKEIWEHLSATKYTEKYTDKGSYHNYLDPYSEILQKYRDKEVSILEIGVWEGFSLNFWWHCFPKAKKILGTDIRTDLWHQGTKDLDERVELAECDSMNKEAVDELLKGQKFDIIIDDGDHMPSSQVETFNNVIEYLADGGTYVVEDVDNRYFTHYIKMFNNAREEKALFPKDCFDYKSKNLSCRQIDLRNKNNRFDDYLIVFQKGE